MKTVFLIVSLISSHHLIGQANWSFVPKIDFDRYASYQGTINGKYPITMYLEESYKPCKEDYSRWTPREVYGWYMYDKIGKKIPLVGHVCYADVCESLLELFVPENPIDYTFDEDCSLIGAKEVIRQKNGWASNRYEWQMKDAQSYPVYLEPTHAFSWSTQATLLLKINNIEIESFNLTELTENEYIENIEILGEKRVEDKFHLLFKYSHQSNPGSYGFGMCGAGVEEFVGHMAINSNFEVASFEKIQTRSCINSSDNVEVFFDVSHPELGLKRQNE